MTWFKVDDGMAFHHKIVAAGNAAVGLWARAGSFCSAQLTDGYVPDHMVTQLGTTAQAQRLVEVGLWIRVGNGYQFHEWNDDGRQPRRAEILAMRERDRKRKAATRAAHKTSSDEDVRADSGRTPRGFRGESAQTPRPRAPVDPTRPVVVAEVVDQRPVGKAVDKDDRSISSSTSSGFAADEQAGIEAIMRKLDCDELWARRTAKRFTALASGPIKDHAAFYGKCISDHVAKQGLDSLLPTPIPKRPLLCEHGLPINAHTHCDRCEGTATDV